MASTENICRQFSLSEGERMIFAMWFSGIDLGKIATTLGVTRVTAGQMLDKARRHVGHGLDRRRIMQVEGVLRRALGELEEIRGQFDPSRPVEASD